jgi:hypothetical protein
VLGTVKPDGRLRVYVSGHRLGTNVTAEQESLPNVLGPVTAVLGVSTLRVARNDAWWCEDFGLHGIQIELMVDLAKDSNFKCKWKLLAIRRVARKQCTTQHRVQCK